MAVRLIALGSMGDVVPQVALAIELQKQGYEVTVATLADFEDFVKRFDVPHASLRASVPPVEDEGYLSLTTKRRPLYSTTGLSRWGTLISEPVAEALDELVTEGDTLVVGSLGLESGVTLAEQRNCKILRAAIAPTLPTSQGVSLINAPHRTETDKRNLSWSRLQWPIAVAMSHPFAVALRSRLGLRPMSTRSAMAPLSKMPVLLAVSPTLVPPAPDWPGHVEVTGAWSLPLRADFVSTKGLAEFIAEGPAPIYIGFGSVRPIDFDEEVELFTSAAREAGQRLVMRPGGGQGRKTGRLAKDTWLVQEAPHSWLLPQMAAVIHHGGAGTMSAALASGVPSAVVAHDFDQTYYGNRSHDLKLGPEPLPRKYLSVSTLAEHIAECTTGPDADIYRANAKNVAAQVAKEDGTGTAVEAMRRLGLLEARH